MRILVCTWCPGGNAAPLLSVSALLAARGHEVGLLASAATRRSADCLTEVEVHEYARTPSPDPTVTFEAQAARLLATAAGLDVATDVHDTIGEARTELLVADCMLPGALAAGEAAGVPTVSLVHFLYGPARRAIRTRRSDWTTDLDRLNATRRSLGLRAVDGLAAWERPDLVLVAAPRWLDLDEPYPAHVVHAGPLGVASTAPAKAPGRRRVCISFSTTAIDGQARVVRQVLDAVADLDVDAVLTDAGRWDDVPPNVSVVPFVDHDELFASCDAVICHAGLGTALRALAHGLPLLMVPLGRDQGFNAGRLEALGLGRAVHATAPLGSIRAALGEVLDEPMRTRAAAAAARIRSADPDGSAAAAIERMCPNPTRLAERFG